MAIQTITIEGFKSIRELRDFPLDPEINILIGANGSGKSNFVSFIRFLDAILLFNNMQRYVNQRGGPEMFLYMGSKETKHIKCELYFADGVSGYGFDLICSAINELIFDHEKILGTNSFPPEWIVLATGQRESVWKKSFEQATDDFFRSKIRTAIIQTVRCVVFHFHDTSDSADVKKLHPITDNEVLRYDASNLAAFLYNLQKNHLSVYEEIRDTVRLVAPFFGDFLLRPYFQNPNQIQLEWTQKDSDIPFHGSQLSDGTLRFICLVAALLQPSPPKTLLLDEPELGLHPYALTILSTLIYAAARKSQLIVSTQSADLLSCFEPHQVIVVERQGNESKFKRLDKAALQVWLDDEYSLGDLWRKNILGGRP